jgi:two-component response regulator (ARR-B family)
LANQHLVQIQPSSTVLFNQVAPLNHHLPPHSSELVNHPSIHIQPSPTGKFNQVDKESHQFAGLCNPSNSCSVGVQSGFPDVCHSAGTSIIGSSQGNRARINQISSYVASSGHVPTFGSEYQNKMAGLSGKTTPMLSFTGQVAPFTFGSFAMSVGSSSVGPALANLQIGNSITPTQMLGRSGSSGNFLGCGTIGQKHSVGDQVNNNNNEHPTGTSEVQDGVTDDVDVFLADWIKQVRPFLFFSYPFLLHQDLRVKLMNT